jgi:uroporphyrinogen III methyltransferase/synthase
MQESGQSHTRPLGGKRVLVTRASAQAQRTCELLEQRGAKPVCMPTIRIVPLDDGRLEQALVAQREARARDSGYYDYLILTSANAARRLGETLDRLGCDGRALFSGVQTCAIGPATAGAAEGIGLAVDLVAEDSLGEGLLAALAAEAVSGRRVLLPRAEVAREILPEQLRERGALVDVIAVYRTELPPPEQIAEGRTLLRAREIDVAIFTSASTARNFGKLLGEDLAGLCEGVVVAAIGPITRQACEKIGLRVDLMPEQYTLPALVDALCAFFDAGGK